MEDGAFAVLDCLGFKGIWERGYEPLDVIGKLSKIEKIVRDESVKQMSCYNAMNLGDSDVQVKLLSDTVAISLKGDLQALAAAEVTKGILVGVMCEMVTKIIDHFLLGQPNLILRGCITFGKHICKDNFLRVYGS